MNLVQVFIPLVSLLGTFVMGAGHVAFGEKTQNKYIQDDG